MLKLSFLRKSPYVLPSEHYGGGRKRIFLGLLSASCLVLGGALAVLLVLPWVLPGEHLRWLGLISLAVGVLLIVALFWLCLTLIIAGMVGSSRMILRQHSLAQVVVGFFVGLLCAYLII